MAEEKGKELEEGTDKLTSKQKWKEHLGLKLCKHKHEAKEEFQRIDNADKDPNYQPEKDLSRSS